MVQNMYELFVDHGKTEREISEALNGRGLLGEYERPWTRSTVYQVLTNPKYIGANVLNRRSYIRNLVAGVEKELQEASC